ncbi:O-antigen ligase family protein [Caldalkalibacillus salinus]|uniref:O-antigen ligase family protein n=1 Tax=Caldalkalibacillus salinus TaxID=2803787 RepID=UPI001922C9D5|nr:O-antigen ligase family protein [Caldalkalibacillus salinus]
MSVLIQLLFISTILLRYREIKEQLITDRFVILLLLGIPLFYAISSLLGVNQLLAANETLQWLSYSAIFIMLLIWLKEYKPFKNGLWILLWLTMSWIVGLVFLVHLNILEYTDALLGSSRRFSSVFQYPNTLASIVSAFVIAGLISVTRRLHVGYQLMYGSTLVPFMVAFLLTDSRGGFLVIIVGWFLGLVFLAWKEQILYVLYTIAIIAISFLGLTRYENYVADELFSKAGYFIILLSVLFMAVVFVVQYVLNRNYQLHTTSKLNIILPAGVFFSGLIAMITMGTRLKDKILPLFPEGLQSRIGQITLAENSVQTRILFYKDAFEVWKDHFWLGGGGGAWRALFEQYQTLPYYSTQAHSFYMQTLVEVGLIGSLFIFGFIIYVLVQGIRYYVRLDEDSKGKDVFLAPAIVIVITMLLHNMIDFNMSFGTYNLFLFSLMALIWSHRIGHSDHGVFQRLKLPKLSYKRKNSIINAVMILIIVVSVFSVYKSYAYAKADSLYEQAQLSGEFYTMMDYIDQAIKLKKDPKYYQMKIQLLQYAKENDVYGENVDEKINEEYQALLMYAPTQARYHLDYTHFLWEQGQIDQAFEHLGLALQYHPWSAEMIQANLHYRMSYLSEIRGTAQAKDSKDELGNVLTHLEERLLIQNTEVPEGLRLQRTIKLNNGLSIDVGIAKYLLGNHEESLQYLEGVADEGLEAEQVSQKLLYTALNYHQLNNQDELTALLGSEKAQELDISHKFEQSLTVPAYKPLQ